MKKIISAVVASVLCTGAFVSCGDKEKGSKGGALSTKGKSEYISIMPLDGQKQPFSESIDEGIKYSMYLAEEYEKENDDEYNPHLIKFSGDEFLMPNSIGSNGITYYDGTFSVKNRKIKFSYENFINLKYDFKININGETEDGESLGIYEDIDDLSEQEKKKLEDNMINAATKSMKKLNETGSFFKYVLPSMNYNDKWTHFSILPFIRYARGVGSFNNDYPNTLYAVDDFLCTDTYGIELDGKYKRGKDFTLKHDFEDTLENDELSYNKGRDDEEELIDKAIERAEHDYDCDDLETTIEFSDGEWEWFNADGGLINNGRYDESKDYPGLVMMYVDEDSKNCSDYALYTYPLWFYIADDGEIYYPGYVKMD